MFNPITAVNDINRFRQIVNVLIKHGFGQLIEQLEISDTYIGKILSKKRQREGTITTLGERLCLVCTDLGPTFVKFGQILSTRTDLLPENITEDLKVLVDRVPPFNYAEVEMQIEDELKQKIEDIFPFFATNPIASASIAQVHKAILPSGEKVVVKVQRPGIQKIIETDIDLLYIIARLIEKNIPDSKIMSPIGIISEFDKAIKKEIDFTIEANNSQKFAQNFKHTEYIVIPKIFREYSGKKILTMEYIEGVKITDAEKVGSDKKILVQRALRAILQMVYIDGFFHSDPHPGNIFALENNRIAILDFGQIGRLNEEMRDKMADMVIAVNLRDMEGVAKGLYNLGIKETKVNYSEFKTDVEEILEKIMGMPLEEISFAIIMKDLFDGAKKHKIRIPHDYTLMGKSLMTIERVGKEMYPDIDLEAEAKPFVEKLVKQRWDIKRIAKNLHKKLINAYELSQNFPVQLYEVLEDLQKGNIKVQMQDPDKEKSLSIWDTISKRIASSLIISALLISSAIFIVFTDDFQLYGFSARFTLGFVGYIFAAFLGASLLISILRSGKLK